MEGPFSGCWGLGQTRTQPLLWVKMDFTLGLRMFGLLSPEQDLLENTGPSHRR